MAPMALTALTVPLVLPVPMAPTATDGADGPDGPDGGLNSVHSRHSGADGFGGNDDLGTTVTATATCASGTLISGGGNVTGNNVQALRGAHLVVSELGHHVDRRSRRSWPARHANGNPPSLTAYALCGA